MNKLVYGVGVNDLDYRVHVREYATKDGGDFTLLAGGVLVDNGDNSVYGINPVEFWNTHERN